MGSSSSLESVVKKICIQNTLNSYSSLLSIVSSVIIPLSGVARWLNFTYIFSLSTFIYVFRTTIISAIFLQLAPLQACLFFSGEGINLLLGWSEYALPLMIRGNGTICESFCFYTVIYLGCSVCPLDYTAIDPKCSLEYFDT